MSLTALPTPPSRADSANFSARGDAFLGALPLFVTELNALAADLSTKQAAASDWAAVAAAAIASGVQPFDVLAFHPGVPDASALVLRMPLARTCSFRANFAGSYFSASANASASTVFSIQKNGTPIGTATIAVGSTSATFATTAGVAQALGPGDVLSIVAPASADTTLANPGFVLAGTR